ncbi:hypothetical protein [Streptomyces bambusae]|uniref:Uncharacterized protein n=1 Tax=Streptomyces bambusae TaxID=1550616 RepID=A0ABS6ZBX2_9ACTN|nr:hypothetical protein [Streptomyces bambusae]MBW5485263.1 hypothetical protein [Streptomyces bambusae]
MIGIRLLQIVATTAAVVAAVFTAAPAHADTLPLTGTTLPPVSAGLDGDGPVQDDVTWGH